jgi:hypothetical protein
MTKVKGSRTVFANNLIQNAAVNAGRRLAVTSSSDNSFTLAIQKGSVNLTPAEYEAAIQAGTGSAPAPAPQLILFARSFVPNSSPLPAGYTVPAGYTSILFVLIGRGGAGGVIGAGTVGGGGGGAGEIVTGILAVTEGQPVSITNMDENPGIRITIGMRTITASNGGDTTGINGINGGIGGNGVHDSDISGYAGNSGLNGEFTSGGLGGEGGALATLPPISSLPFGGGGGGGSITQNGEGKNGGGDGRATQGGGAGGPSFYAIQLTPAGYTGPNLFSL